MIGDDGVGGDDDSDDGVNDDDGGDGDVHSDDDGDSEGDGRWVDMVVMVRG